MATNCFRVVGWLALPSPTNWSPTFVIGCGRSGTTVLGQILNQHRDIYVANEARYLWRAINSDTDIWYKLSRQKTPGGKLCMSATDATDRDRLTAPRMFYAMRNRHQTKYLVDKLPINSFRVEYLKALFPNCQFVNVVRHGLEVAHSIARTGDRWYGPNNGQKWRLLADHAMSKGYQRDFIANCNSHLSKGLVEWTLSNEAAIESLSKLSPNDHVTVRYEELLANPTQTVSSIERSLGWEHDGAMHQYAERTLKRRSKPATELETPTPISDRTHQLLTELNYD